MGLTSVSNNRIQASSPFFLLLHLHLDFVWCLASRYSQANPGGGVLRLPPTTACGFADDAGSSQGVGVEFAKGGLGCIEI